MNAKNKFMVPTRAAAYSKNKKEQPQNINTALFFFSFQIAKVAKCKRYLKIKMNNHKTTYIPS
jgi:hypothetical protein